jgi:hypothetical protein
MKFLSVQILVDSFARGQDALFLSIAQLPFLIVHILALALTTSNLLIVCRRNR